MSFVSLESIKTYCEADYIFSWNYGIALAAVEKYDEALEALQSITDESIKKELTYSIWVAKCFIKVGALEKAWACLDVADQEITYEVLQLIANECYRVGGESFLYATRAFGELYEIDKFPDYLNGLVGSGVGFFRHCIAQGALSSQDKRNLKEVAEILQSIPKARAAAKTIENWIVRYT
jgi:intraflagellar transport protein 56